MPLRIYDNNDWRSPTNVRIYNNGWQDAKVGYVYNLGSWQVVFPDPIIPSYTNLTYGWTRDPGEPAEISIGFRTTTVESAVVYLYNSSTPSGTPIQTAVLTPFTVVGDTTIWDHTFFVSSQGNYSTRVVLTSITENTLTFDPGPLVISYPTVSVLTAGTTDNTDFFVTWSATNQGSARITIRKTSDGSFIDQFLIISTTQRSYSTNTSGSLSNPFLANTQYTVFVTVTDPEFNSSEIASRNFTSVNNPPAVVDITSTSSTCNSITVNWTNSNVSSGTIVLSRVIGIEQGMFIYDPYLTYNFTPPTTSYTFTGLLPRLSSSATQGYYRIESRGVNAVGQQGVSDFTDTETLFPSVNAPTNFTATSDFYGKIASFTWTEATGNCTSVTGYRIEYKLNTSSTWSVLSNSIASSSVSFSAGGIGTTTFAPGRTYNFRIFAKSSVGDSATAATVNLTMNNNPYSIGVSGTNSIETFSSSVLTSQLRNADSENISVSGVTITWSFIGGINPPSGSSVSPTSAVTNSSGQATTTFSSSSDDGTGTVYADAANLGPFGGGQRVMTVSLRSGLTPSLFWSPSASGGTVSNFAYNSSYSYTGSISAGGSLGVGQSYASSSFTVSIPVQNGVNAPDISGDNTNGVGFAGTVTCTISNVWVVNPTVSTISVTSSRLGYNSATGSLSNVSPNRSRTTILYELLNTANGNVMFSTSTNNNSVTYQYPGVDVGKVVRWRCTATFSDGSTSTRSSGTRPLG